MYDFTDGAAMAIWAGLVLFWLIFGIGFYILTAIFLMKIFEKAGVQGKWRAWVPIYNTIIFTKLGDLSPWLILIAIGATILLGWIPVLGWLVGLAAFAISLLAAWRVGLKLQKEPVWVVLYFFLSIVWLGINAFDKSRWNTAVPPAPWAGNSFLSDRTVWAGIPSQTPAGGQPAAPAPGAYPPPEGYAPPPPPAGYQPPAPTAGTAPPAAAPSAPEPPTTPPAPPTQPPTTPPAPPTTPPAPGEPRV